MVDFNDTVKKGQIIAKLDESVLQAQIDQQQAAYDLSVANQRKAQVQVADAKRHLDRQKTLKDQQLVAGATVEQAEVAYDTAIAGDVRLQFLVESIAISLVGGFIGVGVGYLGAKYMASYFGWQMIFPESTAILAFEVSGIVGVAFGMYPAIRASQLDPITAVRYET
jgi:multidrug efflux pump subunit AcrA (membrane-fusion protein)